jgi:hypothetical protein
MAVKQKLSLSINYLILTSLIAGLLLVVANSAIWVNRQVFNTENFTNTAVSSLSSESSRQALGSRITDEVLKDYPVVKSIAGDRLSNLISGLLGTD